MLKKISVIVFALVIGASSMAVAAEAPSTGRTWTYLNLTALLSPNWAFVVMPGHRYEYSRKTDGDYADEKETYFWEFFAGPVYIQKFGDLTLKLPVWYYYMGFPVKNFPATGDDEYFYSHNIEFLPIVEYKYEKWKFINRVIFHNKVYAKNYFYDSKELKRGYSLTLREMVTVEYEILPVLSFSIADEIFIGVVEDKNTNKIRRSNGTRIIGEPYYEVGGFNMNRVYVGLNYKFTPFISLAPQYVYETTYDPDNDGKLTNYNHYIYLTLTYVMKMF